MILISVSLINIIMTDAVMQSKGGTESAGTLLGLMARCRFSIHLSLSAAERHAKHLVPDAVVTWSRENPFITHQSHIRTVFPTHGLYGRPSIFLVTYFCFYYYYYLLHFFLSARDNETIRDRLTSWKSPLARRVSHCYVLKNCPHSHRRSPVFPICWFICGGLATISTAPLPSAPASHTHERDFSIIFSNTFRPFWRLFFPQQIHSDNLATFFEKNLSYRSVGRCLQYCPASDSSDSRRSVSSISVSSVQWAAETEKQHFSWP